MCYMKSSHYTDEGAVGSSKILPILQYAGIAVPAIVAAWGAIKKLSYEDEHGNKRLTAAGQIGLGLSTVSMLVSLLAFGFERMDHATRTQNDLRRQEIAQAKVEEKERRAENRRRSETEAARDQRLKELAEETRRHLDLMTEASKAELRDRQIASGLTSGTRSTLGRVQTAIDQLARISSPLVVERVSVSWSIDLSKYRDDPFVQYLKTQLLKSHEPGWGDIYSYQTSDLESRWIGIALRSKSRHFPSREQFPDWYEFLFAGTRLLIFANPSEGVRDSALTYEERITRSLRSGDYEVQVFPDEVKLEISYDRPEFVWIVAEGTVDPRNVRKTGRVISELDLRSALMQLDQGWYTNNRDAPIFTNMLVGERRLMSVDITTSRRTMYFYGDSIQKAAGSETNQVNLIGREP